MPTGISDRSCLCGEGEWERLDLEKERGMELRPGALEPF